jgi:hypothetical protein
MATRKSSDRTGDSTFGPQPGENEEDDNLRANASWQERAGIAIMVSLFGFLTGMSVWWVLPGSAYFPLFLKISSVFGAFCFVIGLWRPHATLDILGAAGRKIFSFSSRVLGWFRMLR